MNLFKKIIYRLIFVIRKIVALPLYLVINLGTVYAKLIKSIDRRNYNADWQELLNEHLDKFVSQKITVSESLHKEIYFFTPSKIASYRARTFFSKEPETIKWLNKNGSKDKLFFDIGANMGIYSIYFAKMFDTKVFAFEPSFKNLELLTKNIKINSLEQKITLISNPLTNFSKISNFYQNNFIAGQANATFLENDDIETPSNFISNSKEIIFKTLGFSLDTFLNLKIIKRPQLIKIDVDGNEVEIIKGAKNTLSTKEKIHILIETRPETEKEVENELSNLNFKKVAKFKDNEEWEN